MRQMLWFTCCLYKIRLNVDPYKLIQCTGTGLTPVNNSPYIHVHVGTRVKNRNPKNSVKYTQDSMLFIVGLQMNSLIHENLNGGSSAQTLSNGP